MTRRGGDRGEGGDGSARQRPVISDEALARQLQAGDRNAMEQLVRRYVRPVHAVAAAWLTVTADVEDAAQETFLRALRAIASYDPARPFAPWLYQIARNVARTHLEMGARRTTEALSGTLASSAPGPDIVLERGEIRRQVAAAIGELPEQQRTAFHLVDVEGYSPAEVARIMGLSAGTVRSHVHHARRALRRMLAEQHEPLANTGE